MKIRLSLAFLLLSAALSQAAVYYVDQSGGDDGADGGSPGSAWSTLRRASSQTLRPGDYLLLKRGEVWNEALTVSASGSPDLPVTVGAYGTASGRPIIDGAGLARASDLVSISSRHDLTVTGLQLQNSPKNGINAYSSSNLLFRDLLVAGNKLTGILLYNCNHVSVELSELTANSQDASTSNEGIRIDGSGEYRTFSILNNFIHGNLGGDGWNSANGITLGHTGGTPVTIHAVTISGNQITANGNPNQNQAGRGISGTMHGDVTIASNFIAKNASAGLYVGYYGLSLDILIQNNTFYDNALRQFGGFTETSAMATHNSVFVDDGSITAMGAEIGGSGAWTITANSFYYMTTTKDSYRGFIRINDSGQQQVLNSDWNLFYSPTPLPFKTYDGSSVSFSGWQSAGFDRDSRDPHP